MRQSREEIAGSIERNRYFERCAIVAAGVTLLTVSAGAAWLLRTTVQPAIAQTGPRIAATTPSSLPDSPWRPARRPDLTQPVIDRLSFGIDGVTTVTGRAARGAAVTLAVAGDAIGSTVASDDGAWRMVIDRRLGFGDHRLQVRSIQPDGRETAFGEPLRLSVPLALSAPMDVTIQHPEQTDALPSARAQPVVRVAQAPAEKGKTSGAAPVGAIEDWVERAKKTYQDIGVKGVSAPRTGRDPAAATPSGALPVSSAASRAGQPATGLIDSVFDWFKDASDTYQATIAKGLTQPVAKAPATTAETKPIEPAKVASPPPATSAVDATKAEEEARMAAQAKARAADQLKTAQAEREAELRAAEARRKTAEETAKATEDKRVADERKRQSDLQAAEEARQAESARVAAQQSESAKRLAQEAEARRLADAEAKRQADAKATAEARQAETLRAADQQREAAKRSAAEAEAKRAAEAKAVADARIEAAKAAQDARSAEVARLAEAKRAEDAKRANDEGILAAAKAAQTVKAAEEARAKRVAEQRAADDVKRRAMELAEAASKIAIPTPTEGLPPLPSVSTRSNSPSPAPVATQRQIATRSKVAPSPALPQLPSVFTRPPADLAAQSRRLAQVQAPATKPSTVIDGTPRSSLGLPQSAKAFKAGPGAKGSAQQCRLAGRKITPPGYYVVEDGDSLWEIADKHYRDPAKVGVLERANSRIGDVDLIRPCQRLYVPALKNG